MKNIKKLSLAVIVTLVFACGFASSVPKVFAATGGGTATIGVDGGAQGAGVTVVQSTSHIFRTILTIPTGGMTNGASSPTFTIPTGFTAPTLNAVATDGGVNADGLWSVVAGGCTVDSSPSSITTVASGQVITVDITADCAVSNTITLTYQGTSAIAMGATQLVVSTANAGETLPVQALTAGSPTITVTAAPTPTPTPTPTPIPTSTPASGSSSSSSSSGGGVPCIAPLITTVPIIIDSRRISPTSIFISWGPYAGINTFNVEYGLTSGSRPYNISVTRFSTTINGLPANQPIWVQVAATNSCAIGTYGESTLVGGPSLPNTGLAPYEDNISWALLVKIFLGIPTSLVFFRY